MKKHNWDLVVAMEFLGGFGLGLLFSKYWLIGFLLFLYCLMEMGCYLQRLKPKKKVKG